MKTNISILIMLIVISFSSGCSNKGSKKSNTETENASEATAEADSVVQSYSGSRLVKEVPYKNGLRQGLMKTFYANGILRQTFWYEKGVIQDTARWYFEDGVTVYRTTPFKDDSAHGIQTQYYKSGKVKAKLNFVNGLRTPYLEEFTSDGKKITVYPDVVVKTKDEYNLNGTFKIYLELTDKNVKANFYRGEFTDGQFYPKKLKKINSSETTGYLELKKSENPGDNYVGVIAEILTSIGNRNLVYKKIDLPNNNLK